MNKLVLILACAACLAVGVGAAFLLKGYLPTVLASVPNTRQIIEYIQCIPEHIRNGIVYIQQLVQPIIDVVPSWVFGVGASAVSAVALKAWSNVKSREQQAQQALQTTQTEATTKIADLEGQLEAKDKLLTNVTNVQAQLDAANLKIANMQTTIDTTQARYAEASSQVGKVVSPSDPEMARRLKEKGWQVVKPVA